MAYTPTEWECGDSVTVEKMNKIESGVSEIASEYVSTIWECGDVVTAEALNKIEQGIANADSGGVQLTKVTATVNIDHPEYADSISGYQMVEVSNGVISPMIVYSPQATQIVECYEIPIVWGNSPDLYYEVSIGVDSSRNDGWFEIAYRDFVNIDEDNGTIIDPTQDASFTCDATWTAM